MPYSLLHKTITINLLNFVMFQAYEVRKKALMDGAAKYVHDCNEGEKKGKYR